MSKQFTQYLSSTTEGKTIRVSVVKDTGKPMALHMNEGVAVFRDGVIFSFETTPTVDYMKVVNLPYDWTCTKRNRERAWVHAQTVLIDDGKIAKDESIYLM